MTVLEFDAKLGYFRNLLPESRDLIKQQVRVNSALQTTGYPVFSAKSVKPYRSLLKEILDDHSATLKLIDSAKSIHVI